MIPMSDEIKAGDKVEHIDMNWDRCEVVREVITMYGEEYARFNGGGFWVTSRLRKVKSDGK